MSPIKDSSPLRGKSTQIQAKLRRRQSSEATPAYVTGITDGAWQITGEDGVSSFSVPHNLGGLAFGDQVQKTRSNIGMFDFGSEVQPLITTGETSVQKIGGGVQGCTSILFDGTDPSDEFDLNITIDGNTTLATGGSTISVTPASTISISFTGKSADQNFAFNGWVSNYAPINGSTDNPLSFTYPTLDENDANVCPLTLWADTLGSI